MQQFSLPLVLAEEKRSDLRRGWIFTLFRANKTLQAATDAFLSCSD
jgi:hypothetical protein